MMCHRRQPVALAAVKAFVSRDQVPEQIVRYRNPFWIDDDLVFIEGI
jgi:hypothetical protein